MNRLAVLAIATLVAVGFVFTSDSADAQSTTAQDPREGQKVRTNAHQTGATSVVCVTSVDGGGTTILGNDGGLVGRKMLEAQNLGPKAVWCNLNAPGQIGSGRRISADPNSPWAADISENIRVQCNVETTQFPDGGCVIVNEAR